MASNVSNSWPPAEGLSTPTVSHKNAVFATKSSIQISAPAAKVLSILLDTSSYPSWCTWVPNVTITQQPSGTPSDSKQLHLGTRFTYHVVMDSAKPNKTTTTPLKITDLSTPEKPSDYIPADVLQAEPSYYSDLSKVYRVAWGGDGGLFAGGLKSERFHEIVVIGPEACEVRTWEVMGGVLARTVKWMYQSTLSDKFDEWCRDLKKAAEGGLEGR